MTAFALQAALSGCSARLARVHSTLINGLCISPAGSYLGFNLTRAKRPTAVYIVRLADGKPAAQVAKLGPVLMMGWYDDRHFYVLDDGKVRRHEVGAQTQSSEPVRLPTKTGQTVRVTRGAYVPSLDMFLMVVDGGKSGWSLYAVPRSSGRGDVVFSGRLTVQAWGVPNSQRTLVVIASPRSEEPEKENPSVGGDLRLYYYPAVHAPKAFSLGAGRGFTGFGAISRDGRSAVLPYRDYTWKPAGGHLYIVDLPGGKARRAIGLKGGASVARIEGQDSFVIAGPDTFATLDLRSLQLKPIPGGPVGTPSSITTTKNMQAVVATYPDVKIHLVDIESGKRRVLWRAPSRGRS